MPISLPEFRESVTAHRAVLLVQCSPDWFPDGAWTELVALERELARLQLTPGADRCRLTRVLPYDLPARATSTDPARFRDWLDVVSITGTLPDGMRIRIYHSTDTDPAPRDALLVDDEAEAHLERIRPRLIHPPDDWRDDPSGPDHNAYWEGDPP
ncbi:hypothetical protein [Ornithinicoccus hortensis]|uniref:Uncharacterized protein n=1 Tax=Ornithinicoccus hortensis TaxID=82346 RepID=A0A542YTG6_9MICO|nr:hypothetical protein [Ornithinicoccus hortensis]TQL51390.1 hypothetical protein FB467_2536 [Ornithinicoccus hortensis]